MAVRPILVYTDPGIDDFVALSMLMRDAEFEICGIVSLSGNVGLDITVNNALLCKELNGRPEIPVLAGSAKPLCRPARTAAYVHGKSGLGKHVEAYATLPVSDENAAEFAARMARKYDGALEVVSLGPLTDVALALQAAPDIAPRIRNVLIMGGGIRLGNASEFAEFNILADPEAAEKVFSSGIPVEMVGLDATHACVMPRSMIPQPGRTRMGQLIPAMLNDYVDAYKNAGIAGMVIHDAICVLMLTHPEWFTCARMNVHVCLEDGAHLGQTAVREGTPNCTVAMDANAEAIGAYLDGFLHGIAQ